MKLRRWRRSSDIEKKGLLRHSSQTHNAERAASPRLAINPQHYLTNHSQSTPMTSPTLLLRHIHLPHITPFSVAQSLQSALVQQILAHKARVSSQALHNPSPSEPLPPPTPPPPAPTILTFTPAPTYTLGRREHDSLSSRQKALLRA